MTHLPQDHGVKRRALQLIHTLNDAGYEAYLVGGCVRDEVLGRPVKDYDIATSARPEQVESLFSRTIPTGLQHGTVTVVIEREPFEVTTFRKEAGYEDFRRPSEVSYIDSLLEDLRRRDFTMNAMALDAEGRLIDPFGGQADAASGVLRCVGDAHERFSEDALRMLRCVRFAAEYRLEVEPLTWEALTTSAPLLRHIALERVRAELERMLSGSDPNRALLLLGASKLLLHTKSRVLWSELQDTKSWPSLSVIPTLEGRLAYLYIGCGADLNETKNDMRVLTFSKKQLEETGAIVAAHRALIDKLQQDADEGTATEDEQRKHWLLTAVQYGAIAMESLRQLYELELEHERRDSSDTAVSGGLKLSGAQKLAAEAWAYSGSRWLTEAPALELKQLALTGQQLVQLLGVKPGPWTGQLLSRLLEETALGFIPNEPEALAAAAKSCYELLQEKG
ncbi:CCA tRNA nucleotidyltransferase [Paenibacillus sp. YYML68]|uniref:CCA tRNA nucleotidyltransferase n=1 Tax=Paenibacillus sp. YYML68 TaxID=2909250 RepID=UPI0024923158|nr:CCA tRNA nucleotidyltransferase [Paenibacillus sp. YYML68]